MRNRLIVLLILTSLFVFSGCLHKIKQVALSDEVAAEALGYALSVEGSPYVLGGRGPDVFDCSGLIVWSYKQAYPDISFRVDNKRVPDVSMNGIWKYNIVPITPTDMRPGDIVFITGSESEMTHGGMFIEWVDEDTFRFINASSYYGAVVIDEWPIRGEVRGQWFAGAGRLQAAY